MAMWYLPWRIRPPTESEMNVLFWIIVAIFVGFGLVCLFFGYRAPAEKAQEAAGLIRGGYGFIALGVAIWAARRFFSGYSA
jgi:hypothetical protein